MKEWLEFRETLQLPNRKTKRFNVWSKCSESVIGSIKWYPQWRHYCFFPEEYTVYSDRCLIEISKFIAKLNTNHKNWCGGKKMKEKIYRQGDVLLTKISELPKNLKEKDYNLKVET